ncbi:MAG TPA: hypothetical protein VGQ58_06035 [Candidatus Limnocylindrales bacterium]|jgi:hypothetical protein|nr:hypothetical protein [Candidatus Limnocylindrales bacterium]
MPRASRSRSDGPGFALRLGGVVALFAGAIVAACGPAAPLASIDTEPTPLPSFEAARLAFVEKVTSGDLTYHATFKGLVYGAGNDVAVSGSLDVGGADYQYAASYTFPEPPNTSFAIRYVDGTAWERVDNGKWKANESFGPADTNSPFAFITRPSEVRYSKTETVNGRSLHQVRFTSGQLIGLAQIQAGNLTNEEFKRSTFDLVLDDGGDPVTGTVRIEGVARVSGQLQEIVVQLDLLFSKVGADIVIKAP